MVQRLTKGIQTGLTAVFTAEFDKSAQHHRIEPDFIAPQNPDGTAARFVNGPEKMGQAGRGGLLRFGKITFLPVMR